VIEGLVSIVLATYNRAHLLWRSLECYARQSDRGFELIILDDASQDDTTGLVDSFRDKIPVVLVRLTDKSPGEWRDAAAVINRGIKMSRGEFVYITHPEVMLCFDGVEKLRCSQREQPYDVLMIRTYYLTQSMQENLDMVPWRDDFYAVRRLPRFYDNPEPLYQEETLAKLMNNFCTPRYTDEAEVWNSWVFGGMSRAAWKRFGGLTEFSSWGSTDIDFHCRRDAMGLRTVTPADIYVIHQNHDRPEGAFVPSPKTSIPEVMEKVRKNFFNPRNYLEDMEM
jgi:glycosyltransferase involved in cell wall biosynthesis